jgi:membrane complex biogenesis BtpA family protein
MIHLRSLRGSVREALDSALADAAALRAGGIDALMVENFGDVPFRKGAVDPHTVAAMTAIAWEVRRAVDLPLGINVLRNDARAALAIAATVGAEMIRVNVHTGATVTDQGIIEGDAAGTVEYRRQLGVNVRIMADVNVKHGRPLGDMPIEEAASDAVERGRADALIVTGARTGSPAASSDIDRVRAAVSVPLFVGSGVTPESASLLRGRVDGVIVGSWLKRGGEVAAPVDADRVEQLVEAFRSS